MNPEIKIKGNKFENNDNQLKYKLVDRENIATIIAEGNDLYKLEDIGHMYQANTGRAYSIYPNSNGEVIL